MRIVAGSLKGRAIVAPEGQGTRPTSDRARQAVFNVLEHAAWSESLNGLRVIDLYAGSGALGFEAISRGAGFCCSSRPTTGPGAPSGRTPTRTG